MSGAFEAERVEIDAIKAREGSGHRDRDIAGRTISPIDELHRRIGNRAAHGLITSGREPLARTSRLQVSHPEDPIERQATTSATGLAASLKSSDLRREIGNPSGDALPVPVRTAIEPQLGHRLADVRVYSGARAAASASALDADAFTLGSDIVVGAGFHAAGPRQRVGLLAHEIAHTAQYQAGAVAGPTILRDKPLKTAKSSDGPRIEDAFSIELASARTYQDKSRDLAKKFTSPMALTGRGRLGEWGNWAPISNLYWFAKLYQIITDDEVLAARSGWPAKFDHPEFILHFIPVFYDLYYDSLQAFLSGDFKKVSPLWQTAFETATRTSEPGLGDISAIMASVATGVAAHIQGDMTTALVRAFRSFVDKYRLMGITLDYYRKDFFDTNRKVFDQVKVDFIDQLAIVGPFPGDVDVTRQALMTGERITKMGLDVDTVYAWRKTAWDQALTLLAAKPAASGAK